MGSQVIAKGSQVNQLHGSCKMVKFPFTIFLSMLVLGKETLLWNCSQFTSSGLNILVSVIKKSHVIKCLYKKSPGSSPNVGTFLFVQIGMCKNDTCRFVCRNKTFVTSHMS